MSKLLCLLLLKILSACYSAGIISYLFGRIDEENCVYYIAWDTRAACAVKPQEVEVVNGTVINPTTGKNFSLGDVYYK